MSLSMLFISLVFVLINAFPLSSQEEFNLLVNNNHKGLQMHTKLNEIKDDFSKYLTKFHSQSCLIKVLSTLTEDCSKLSDEAISQIAYDLTICSFNKIGKKLPLCSQSKHSNPNACLRDFEGDLWTTYSTFTQHVDNLCFFYKSVIWEKSSDFLFMQLANSSMGILSDLQSSMQLAQSLFSVQEKMSLDLTANISEAIDKIGSVNKLFENYTEIELRLKEELNEIESKLRNNVVFNGIGALLDDKGGVMNTFTFFFIYLGIVLAASVVIGEKGRMLLCGIVCLGCEVYIVNPRLNKAQANTIEMIYMRMIVFVSRVLYYVIAGVVCCINLCYKKKDSLKRKEATFSEMKNVLGMTPMWVRKYFSRVENNNEHLVEDFKKMVNSMKEQR